MDNSLKENGEMVKKMDLELGNLQKETFMKEDGKITSKMVKAYSCMLEVQNIRDNLKIS